MPPYYQDEWATLYLGDCRQVLPTLEREVDLLVTDPPYGVDYQSGFREDERIALDGKEEKSQVLDALNLAIKRLRMMRHLYVFGPIDMRSLPVTGVTGLIWDKGRPGMGDLASPWATSHEPVTFAIKADAANRKRGRGDLAGRLRKQTVLRVQRMNATQCRRHPTEKPVPLLRDLIESSSMLDETVLDPFAGVGSTLVAAKIEGRKSVGIEIDEKYCKVAAERLAAIKEVAA